MLLRILLIGWLPLLAWGQTGGEPLGAAREIRELDRRSAAKALPVVISGVVTFSTNQAGFILDDGSAGIFVAVQEARMRGFAEVEQDFEGGVKTGMRLEITGVTSRGGFAPVILPKRIRSLGFASLPMAKVVEVVDLQTGRHDGARVRVRGVVQHASYRTGGEVQLELAAVGSHFVAYAARPEGFDWAKLVDAEVDLTGVALSFFNERGEILGARVQLEGAEDLEILVPAPEDPFSVPELGVDLLLPFSPTAPSLHRRRISGLVTICRPGAYFYLQDGERALRVSTRSLIPLTPGDRVDVAGFIELREYFAEMREGIFRKTGAGELPKPVAVNQAKVVRADRLGIPGGEFEWDGRRVILHGQLERVDANDRDGCRLSLLSDGHLIFATLANDPPPNALERLVRGSEVAVTGICQVQLSAGRPILGNPVAIGFQLLVHSPADVEVIAVPPWWNAKRLGLALGLTVAVVALTLAWVWLLRRRVAQRSAQLAAEIGARRNAELEFDATLRERKRMAGDLHDTLEQALTGLALQLEASDLFQNREPDRSRHHLHLARQFLARSREDVRRSVWNLRAQGLEGRSLEAALRAMLDQASADRPVTVHCAVQGEPFALPDWIASNLLLLAQEAVTNAVKHAQPDVIGVHLVFSPEALTLRIEDDGRGFNPGKAPGQQEGHFGLQGMRERVKRLGGSLQIESESPGGTRIEVRVPASCLNSILDD